MNGTFNGQILIEKLAKLNNSQQSIETLSHWCIFHRKKAKQVVETWDQQFHCSPREQRVSFLYLANDILQNSRRKGSEFVAEFWKVLPNALRDVIVNGDEFGRNAALRLVDIWEERKVFGSRGQILKEELVGVNLESNSKNGIGSGFKLKKSVGDTLEKIISSYEVVYDGPVDEEALLSKCRTAISSVEKVEKEIGGNHSSVQLSGPAFVEELQSQRSILGDCIEQLNAAESSRETLVSHLRDALQEQEFKLAQVRNELQAAQARSEQADNICEQLVTSNNGQPLLTEQRLKEANTFPVPETPVMGGDKGQPFPITSAHIEEDTRKSAAAAVAAKLAASTSSAQMLSYVLSSLASEGVIGNPLSESSNDYRSEKRPKLENGPSSYIPFHHPQPPPPPPPPPPFPHPDSVQLSSYQPPPPPSSSPISRPSQPPPLPPMPPPHSLHFMQTAGSMSSVPYSYGMSQQRPPPLPGYPMDGGGMPPIPSPPPPYQNFQGSEGGFFSQPPLPATPPISRQ